jgi:hypothetical protein
MIKSWSKKGLPLWVTQDLSIPMVSGTLSYMLGPTATGTGSIIMSRPLKVIDAFIRDVNGYDTPLIMISRQEYDMQGQKSSSGTPNQYYYDRQEPNGVLYLFNVPSDSTHTVHAQIQRQFYDMTTSTDAFDFPEEWFEVLKWNLASGLSMEYGISQEMIPYFDQKASMLLAEAFDYSVEESSVYFTVRNQ